MGDEKSYKQASFERSFRLAMSLEDFKERLLSLRFQGYQVNIQRNVYEDDLFKITGFAGTVFELEGVAQSLEDELIEVRYNQRYEFLKMRLSDRFGIIAFFFVSSFLLSAGLQILSPDYPINIFWLFLSLAAWIFFIMVTFTALFMNPYQSDMKQALAALAILEEKFIDSLINPEEKAEFLNNFYEVHRNPQQNPRIHES